MLGLSAGQLVVIGLVIAVFVVIATRPDFRRRLAGTPPVRLVSLVGLAVVTIVAVLWVANLIQGSL